MKKLLVLGISLMLLAGGCRSAELQQEPDASAILTSSFPAGDSRPITTEDLLLRDYVQIYEKYCGGVELPGEPDLREQVMQAFMVGWLKENGRLDEYAVYNRSQVDYYALPMAQVRQFYRLYFDGRATAGASNLRIDADQLEVGEMPELHIHAHRRLDNGNYELTVRRVFDGREWMSAVYEFAPVVMNDTPGSMLTGMVAQGGAAYRIERVRNQPPEQSVQGEIVTISTPQDLVRLSELVNEGDWRYQDNIYRLTADLDMTDIDFEPIGTYLPSDVRDPAPRGFGATFDGSGYAIRNLRIQQTDAPAGLFARLSENGFITDLRLENCDISMTQTGNADALYAAGGLVAEMDSGAIGRCSVSGTVSGYASVGGLVGRVGAESAAAPSIQECRADVAVSGSREVGALVGTANSGRFYACTATGQVNGLYAKKISLPDPEAQLPIQAIGGFIGHIRQATIDRGIVSAQVSAGGFAYAGGFAGSSEGKLFGCFYNRDLLGGLPTIGGVSQGVVAPVDLIALSDQELKSMGVLDQADN